LMCGLRAHTTLVGVSVGWASCGGQDPAFLKKEKRQKKKINPEKDKKDEKKRKKTKKN